MFKPRHDRDMIAVNSMHMPVSVQICLFQLNLNAAGIGPCAYCD